MAKLCPLFSSSSGNCFYLSAGNQAVLIDAGVSCKRTLTALTERGVDPASIQAIFITHSHSDHVKGLRVLLSKLHIPVFASRETLGALLLENALTEGEYFDIEEKPALPVDFGVSFFKTSHDCPGSGGYVFTLPSGERVAFCTDLGVVTETVRQSLNGCKTVVLESNHDVGMLQNGSYPFSIKQRILGESGHLSNGSCAMELPGLVQSGTCDIVLAHLSRENNTPELAEITAVSLLLEHHMRRDSDYRLQVARPLGGKMLYI